MSRFTKKILLPVTQEMYNELLYRSRANGTSVNAEIRIAIGASHKSGTPTWPDNEGVLDGQLRRVAVTSTEKQYGPLTHVDDALADIDWESIDSPD